MKNIAIIGAGEISKWHLDAYRVAPDAKVVAIRDLNENLAKARAVEFGIAQVYTDYHEMLADPTIDAVSVAAPTFTHSTIVKDALYAGKLGDIYYAEAYRMQRCSKICGWFCDKTKSGGGEGMDAAIHQLDLLLYYFGYPKIKSIRGLTSDVNKDLPQRIRGLKNVYAGADNRLVERTAESFSSCYITFEGGKNLFLKAAHIANTLNPGTQFELIGNKGGACVRNDELHLLTIDESNYFMESQPVITHKETPFHIQVRHFLDCCDGKTECNSNAHQGTELIRIMNTIYESADIGKEILF